MTTNAKHFKAEHYILCVLHTTQWDEEDLQITQQPCVLAKEKPGWSSRNCGSLPGLVNNLLVRFCVPVLPAVKHEGCYHARTYFIRPLRKTCGNLKAVGTCPAFCDT